IINDFNCGIRFFERRKLVPQSILPANHIYFLIQPLQPSPLQRIECFLPDLDQTESGQPPLFSSQDDRILLLVFPEVDVIWMHPATSQRTFIINRRAIISASEFDRDTPGQLKICLRSKNTPGSDVYRMAGEQTERPPSLAAFRQPQLNPSRNRLEQFPQPS